MTSYKGQCHCGALEVEFESTVAPGEIEVRECQCSFCRMHRARAASDPAGAIRFTEQTPGTLNRYRFGLNTADFIVCNTCGAYMGVVLTDGDDGWGVVNIHTLRDGAKFTSTPIAADYDKETTPDRIARRKKMWTPAAVNT